MNSTAIETADRMQANTQIRVPFGGRAMLAPVSISLGGMLFCDMNEEWRPVAGYEGLYEVSNLGNVRTLSRLRIDGHQLLVERQLKPSVNGVGYRVVSLSKNRLLIKKYIGRLVAEAFIPNPNNKKEVNHISGVKTDDSVQNLEWVTPRENMEHAKRIGLNRNYGEGSGNSILTVENVREIRDRFIPYKVTGNELAKQFGVSRKNIYDIVKRRLWKCVK